MVLRGLSGLCRAAQAAYRHSHRRRRLSNSNDLLLPPKHP
ncbi:hypothetical protein HMPREF0580_0345 [Mobiluncus mulieris ATCC 35239]|uniref:Uncharacterized protein n=1 Tax=Mobiluncus mulieris ATCC 35239 TaxID=871571 RepID=E0QN81_9ACTO|nr:hypothetical protein HMPREF0580_0345 [Mobiluncus mulieris ATCC 35239]